MRTSIHGRRNVGRQRGVEVDVRRRIMRGAHLCTACRCAAHGRRVGGGCRGWERVGGHAGRLHARSAMLGLLSVLCACAEAARRLVVHARARARALLQRTHAAPYGGACCAPAPPQTPPKSGGLCTNEGRIMEIKSTCNVCWFAKTRATCAGAGPQGGAAHR